MKIEASAPGKLVVLGEYAVLDGAPALALAVSQRARARLSSLAQGPSRLLARPVLDRVVDFTLVGGDVSWSPGLAEGECARLAWVGDLIAALDRSGRWPDAPVEIELDTREFHAAGGKLGLGSSAALVVALARAGARASGKEDSIDELNELVALHSALQGGGSGIDVAASLHGGVVRYRRDAHGRGQAEPLALPAGLQLLAVSTGVPVSTTDSIGQLRAWAERHPAQWLELRGRLGAAAEIDAAAIEQGAAELVQAIDHYAGELRMLESATGLAIHGGAHERPAALAAQAGVAYKPSGAGGDLGIAAGLEVERIEVLRERATGAGLRCLPLDGMAAGVQVESTSAEEAST